MSTEAFDQPAAAVPPAGPPTNYLNASYSVVSWLLTTDHKRIAILYLLPITLMFFIGGVAISH